MRFAELALALGQRQSLGPDELLLGSWRLLLQVAARDPHEMDELTDTTIGAALAADGATSGDLLATLRTYLDQGGRLNATADAVHAHRRPSATGSRESQRSPDTTREHRTASASSPSAFRR
jgi:DNA-binding PucR family transcriptional regulator